VWPVRSSCGVALAALALLGCSLTTADRTECTANAECRDAFGFGWVCGDEGFCAASRGEPRCTNQYPENLFLDPVEHTDTIVFGMLMDESLATHRARERSARLALRQANEEGGLALRRFGVVFCTVEEDPEFDSRSREEAGVAMAGYLIDTLGVPAIIGPAASDDVDAVFKVYRDRGVLFMSPSATSPALTALDPADVSDEAPGLLWRTAPPDSLQGAAIAYDMGEPGVGRTATVSDVAVIYQTGSYGEALSTVFAQTFMDTYGGGITLLPYDEDGERATMIGMAAQSDADEVLFVSSQTRQVIEFMDAAATAIGLDGKGIFLTDSAANPDLLRDAAPDRFDQVRGTRQAPRDENADLVYAAFIAAYSAEYGEDVRPFSFTANSYDAAWLLVYGSAWSLFHDDRIHGAGIGKGLRRISDGPLIEIRATTWNQIRERFQRGESVDIAGASGHLDYDPVTEETTGTIETWHIDDGSIVGLYTWPPAGGDSD
jgi:ABC-type branched-subunit amino acid transport system substrate-binding protein